MKHEVQPTAELALPILVDIINKLPDPSKYPNQRIKYSFQTIINEFKPFSSEIDKEFDTTEIIFYKGEINGEKCWMLDQISRVRTTIYFKDYIQN